MEIKKFGHAMWKGPIKEGKGVISTESTALQEQPYGFNTRFEDKAGTNPEELIGAAHAACFSMALSKIVGEANLSPEMIDTKATVTLEKKGEGFEISMVHLAVKMNVPNADQSKMEELATKAKECCPGSKLFNAKIEMDVQAVN